jgi:hypothetical protein
LTDFNAIKQMAYTRQPADELIAGYERAAYWELFFIYATFANGLIDKEAAANDAKRAENTFNAEKKFYERNMENNKYIADFFASVELANSRYRKDRTVNNADALSDIVCGLKGEIE